MPGRWAKHRGLIRAVELVGASALVLLIWTANRVIPVDPSLALDDLAPYGLFQLTRTGTPAGYAVLTPPPPPPPSVGSTPTPRDTPIVAPTGTGTRLPTSTALPPPPATPTPIPIETPTPVMLPTATRTPTPMMLPTTTRTPPIGTYTPIDTPVPAAVGDVRIMSIFCGGVNGSQRSGEYVVIRNNDVRSVQLYGWTLRDEQDHVFTFPSWSMAPGQVCRIYTNENRPEWCGFNYGSDTAIWDSDGDIAYLRDGMGALVDSRVPRAPGVEIGPDHTRQARAGRPLIYRHVLANTGTTTDTIWLEVTSTQGWPVELSGGDYPTGTLGGLVIPRVGAQMTTSFQVSLTVPLNAAGITEITLVTATSLSSPGVADTARDTTFVLSTVCLPLVLRDWFPGALRPTPTDVPIPTPVESGEVEPNDTFAQASVVNVPFSVRGSITVPTDLDYFVMATDIGREYDATLTVWDNAWNGHNLRLSMRLFNGDKEYIKSSAATDGSTNMSWLAVQSWYYLRIEAASVSTETVVVQYRLDVNRVAVTPTPVPPTPVGDPYEPNDSFATAYMVPAAVSIVLEGADFVPCAGCAGPDEDWFAYYVKAGRECQAATANLVDADTYLEVFDEDGVLIAADDDGGGGFASKAVWQASYVGYYRVRVTNLIGTSGTYDLALQQSATLARASHR
jgi:hypothetical protein